MILRESDKSWIINVNIEIIMMGTLIKKNHLNKYIRNNIRAQFRNGYRWQNGFRQNDSIIF